jgi:hypothetical protein
MVYVGLAVAAALVDDNVANGIPAASSAPTEVTTTALFKRSFISEALPKLFS